MPNRNLNSFCEFRPYYVNEHSRPANRLLQFAGTTIATACLASMLILGKWIWLPLAIVPGYAAAWIGHFFIEHNRPATFKHPLWSFIGDYKMVFLMLTGRMKTELERMKDDRMSELKKKRPGY